MDEGNQGKNGGQNRTDNEGNDVNVFDLLLCFGSSVMEWKYNVPTET